MPKATKKWYVTKRPSAPYEEYDFASNEEQAKDMLESLSYMGAIAEKTTRQGGEYVIWVKPIPPLAPKRIHKGFSNFL